MSSMAKQRMTRKSATVVIAESASTWDPLDWWRLEGSAWAGTKDVAVAYAQIAPPSTLHAMRPPGTPPFLRILTGVWILITFVGGIVLHVFGLALIAGPLLRGDGDVVELGWGGLCFGAAAVLIAIDLLLDSGRSDDGGGSRIVAVLYLVPALLALIAIAAAAATGMPINGWIGSVGVACGLAMGLACWFASVRARRRTKQTPIQRLDRAVVEAPARVRVRVLAEIYAGIEILARRELISAAEAEKATAAEAGHLGLTLAPGSARATGS